MDGGILEKAKRRDLDDEATEAADDVEEVAEAESNGGASGLLERIGDESEPSSDEATVGKSSDKLLAIITGVIGVALVVMLPSLPAFSGFGVLAVFGISFWFASRHSLATSGLDALSSRQWATLAVAYLMLAGIPYFGGMDFGGATSITDVSYSEDGQSVSLTIRHSTGLTGSDFSSGDIDVRVIQNGAAIHSLTESITFDQSDVLGTYGTLVLTVADFYQGNSVKVANGEVVYENYTIEVQILGSDAGRTHLDAFEMTRTVDDVDEKMTALFDADGDCEAGKNRCVRGIYLEIAAGRANSQGDAGIDPTRVKSNYWVNATISHADSTEPVLVYPTIEVNGNAAIWDDMDGTYGNGSGTIGVSSSRMILDGSLSDPVLGVLYMPKEDWDEHGFGCYTFTVTITQEPPWSGTSASTVTESGTYLWEDIEGEQHPPPAEEEDPDYEEFQRASC